MCEKCETMRPQIVAHAKQLMAENRDKDGDVAVLLLTAAIEAAKTDSDQARLGKAMVELGACMMNGLPLGSVKVGAMLTATPEPTTTH